MIQPLKSLVLRVKAAGCIVYQRRELALRISKKYPLQGQIRAHSPGRVRLESEKMGEKGNLVDIGEEIFANLAEQGPQFWLDYEQYKLSRAQGAPAPVVAGRQAVAVERDAAAQDAPAEFTWPRPPVGE